MKTREQKRKEAETRAALRATRTNAEQCLLLDKRPGQSQREGVRLIRKPRAS